MISRTGAHWGGQAEAEARGAGSAEGSRHNNTPWHVRGEDEGGYEWAEHKLLRLCGVRELLSRRFMNSA